MTQSWRLTPSQVVINTASTFHTASAKAMIVGLGERKKQTKQAVHFIHVSLSECNRWRKAQNINIKLLDIRYR